MQTTAEYVAEQIAARPVEATIIRMIVRSLKEAGNPVIAVDDSEEVTPVSTEKEILELAFNLDGLYLETLSGAWVRLEMGEGYDMVSNWLVSLDDAMAPVNKWIEDHDV